MCEREMETKIAAAKVLSTQNTKVFLSLLQGVKHIAIDDTPFVRAVELINRCMDDVSIARAVLRAYVDMLSHELQRFGDKFERGGHSMTAVCKHGDMLKEAPLGGFVTVEAEEARAYWPDVRYHVTVYFAADIYTEKSS